MWFQVRLKLYSSLSARQIGNNLMTKFVLENGEELPLTSHDLHYNPDPAWMARKRTRATLAVAYFHLLRLKKDAIFNSHYLTGVTLPVDLFSYVHTDRMPQKYAHAAGEEYFTKGQMVAAMESKLDTIIPKVDNKLDRKRAETEHTKDEPKTDKPEATVNRDEL